MHPGRKILNLRCDREVSQQELARACDISPSTLSKIEAGINSPRAAVIWRIAQNLGVTIEYLLDEDIPYPCPAHDYRRELVAAKYDPEEPVDKEVSREEAAFIDALRGAHPIAREIALSLPGAPMETIRLVHFLMHHARLEHPRPEFWESLRQLVRGHEEEAGEARMAREAGAHPGELEGRPAAATRRRVPATAPRPRKPRNA